MSFGHILNPKSKETKKCYALNSYRNPYPTCLILFLTLLGVRRRFVFFSFYRVPLPQTPKEHIRKPFKSYISPLTSSLPSSTTPPPLSRKHPSPLTSPSRQNCLLSAQKSKPPSNINTFFLDSEEKKHPGLVTT